MTNKSTNNCINRRQRYNFDTTYDLDMVQGVTHTPRIPYSYACNAHDAINIIMNSPLKSLQQFHTTNKNFPCVLVSKTGHIVYVNHLWCDLCKYTTTEVIGNTFNFLKGPKTDHSVCTHFTKQLHKTGTAEMDVINYDKNDNELYLHVECHRLNKNIYVADDHIPYFIGKITKNMN
jgi:PAS domain-containing protein